MNIAAQTVPRLHEHMEARNRAMQGFFDAEAPRLAAASRAMAERFLAGGRLLAFGQGSSATDAQHVSVEFVHPVIVGKRALPAVDLSGQVPAGLEVLLRPQDIVMGFAPPGGDPDVDAILENCRRRGAMTFALPGPAGDCAIQTGIHDPLLHQEIIEVLYHTLWETVHVFLEHAEVECDAGESGFLYPFLGPRRPAPAKLLNEVAASIRMKVADDAALRDEVGAREAGRMTAAAAAMLERVRRGGQLLLMGNGGSATDANDWALDCRIPPAGFQAIPALSLASEPAILTAVGNDVGMDLVFLRQLVAHARPADVAIFISTSGGSRNLIVALEEARRRGLLTVALLGYDGGEIARRHLADFPIVVRCGYIPRIQEVQASVYHGMIVCMEELRRAAA